MEDVGSGESGEEVCTRTGKVMADVDDSDFANLADVLKINVSSQLKILVYNKALKVSGCKDYLVVSNKKVIKTNECRTPFKNYKVICMAANINQKKPEENEGVNVFKILGIVGGIVAVIVAGAVIVIVRYKKWNSVKVSRYF